jgi:chromosome segregation ATPase
MLDEQDRELRDLQDQLDRERRRAELAEGQVREARMAINDAGFEAITLYGEVKAIIRNREQLREECDRLRGAINISAKKLLEILGRPD